MIYQQYAGFVSNLTGKLSNVGTSLPMPEHHLSLLKNRVSDGKYTFLKLFDGTNVEYIKVSNVGGELHIERGLELTGPTTFPVGSCVKWELTPTAVCDIICQMSCY